MLYSIDDVKWLLDRGILRLETYFDMVDKCPAMHLILQIPEGLQAVIEANKTDLYIEQRERDGARYPVLE